MIVGAAHKTGANPPSRRNVKGYVRGFDVRTGKRLWIFHTIPTGNEFGNDSWKTAPMSTQGTARSLVILADEDLGLVYLPVELPTGDYYGGYRPGNGLFGESLVAVDLKTGQRKWHYQLVHHGIWDMDIPCAPILVDITVNGRAIKALLTDQAGFPLCFRSSDRKSGSANCWKNLWRRAMFLVNGIRQPSRFRPAAGLRPEWRFLRRPHRLHSPTPCRSIAGVSRYKLGPNFTSSRRQQTGRPARNTHNGNFRLAGRTGQEAPMIRRPTFCTCRRKVRSRRLAPVPPPAGFSDMLL